MIVSGDMEVVGKSKNWKSSELSLVIIETESWSFSHEKVAENVEKRESVCHSIAKDSNFYHVKLLCFF